MERLEFSGDEILAAGLSYHDMPSEYDAKAEETYRDLVLNRWSRPPLERVEDAVTFLVSWKAHRFPGGTGRLREILPPWLKANGAILDRLRSQPSLALGFDELNLIFYLYASLREERIGPTACGKYLHFLLPEVVFLWDAENVRAVYDLDDNPYSFLVYQSYGQALLNRLSRGGGPETLKDIRNKHRKVAGVDEPLTKLVDELAYEEDLANRAVESLGGWDQAFRLVRPPK